MGNIRVSIFGGTGQTGKAVAEALRARGAAANQLSRDDLVTGSPRIAGADVGYVIAPNMHPDEPTLVRHILELLRAADVPRVVYHSVSAPYVPAMRHHVGKAVSEDFVRRSLLEWTIMQPCAYTQNFLPDRAEIRVPFSVDAPFGLVDLRDVGEAAAEVCLDGAHAGATYELGGPAAVTVLDLARAASQVLARPVHAVTETTEAWIDRYRDRFSTDTLGMFIDMWNYYDAYGLPTGGRPLRMLLGRRANSIADVLASTRA